MSSPLDTPPHLFPRDPGTTREEPESARLRFRGFCYQEAAGPREALAQLRELCRQWLRPEAHSKEQMLELLVLEQFLVTLPPEIQAWVRGQQPGSPEEAAALVEGLQHDPGQLLDWITAHILKRKELPAAQKEESLGNPHSSGIMEPPGSAPGEGPQDSGMEEPGQLSCSVKEEPDADVQEMAPPSSMSLAQSPEEHLRHREPASIPSSPPSIQERWGLLEPSQKELYWDAMVEKYGAVVSLGLPRAPPGAQAGSGAGAGTPCAGTRLHGGLGPAGQDQGRPEAQPPRGPGPVSREGPCGAPASARPTGPGTPPAHAASAPPGRKRYTCEQCGRGFDWKSVFVIHHRTHQGGPGARAPSPARAAEEQGPREQAALRSPRRGPGPRSYECEECGRGFSWKSQLVIHRKSHTGQRRHCCRDCGRGFDWKSQLVIHRKSHRPEAP